MGGIGGFQNAPCGAVSASAVCLGLRHRSPLNDKEDAKQARHRIRMLSARIVSEFNGHFGNIACLNLVGMDFSKPGQYQKFLEAKVWKHTCEKYVEFIIEKLYEVEADKGLFVQAR